MEKDVKKVLNFIISFLELVEIQRLKAQAVKEQDFLLAVKYREEEVMLQMNLPNLEQLKELRNAISNRF
jgi:hypothetical protein